jgi:rod shape-determining protein MreB
VVVGIPSGVTEVERRAVHDATCSAGAREALLIEEPMAAAIGSGLPITEPSGSMIVDIGGGTTEVAVISLGGLVAIRSIRIAGDEMDQDIVSYVRQRHNLMIGERMAEEIKIAAGSAHPACDDRSITVRGRDVLTGLPGEIVLASTQVREATSGSINAIVEAVTETIEETPPELVADMMTRGITMAGGGALLPGLDRLIAERTGIEVQVAEDPLQSVVRGTGRVLEDLDMLRKVLVDLQDGKGPRRR